MDLNRILVGLCEILYVRNNNAQKSISLRKNKLSRESFL